MTSPPRRRRRLRSGIPSPRSARSGTRAPWARRARRTRRPQGRPRQYHHHSHPLWISMMTLTGAYAAGPNRRPRRRSGALHLSFGAGSRGGSSTSAVDRVQRRRRSSPAERHPACRTSGCRAAPGRRRSRRRCGRPCRHGRRATRTWQRCPRCDTSRSPARRKGPARSSGPSWCGHGRWSGADR